MEVYVVQWFDGDDIYGVFNSLSSFLDYTQKQDKEFYDDCMYEYHKRRDAGEYPVVDIEYIENNFGLTVRKFIVI